LEASGKQRIPSVIPIQYLCCNQNENIMLSKEEVADVIGKSGLI
jgi:hypothetical protein